MNNENTSIRILKIATCPSLSGRSTLTYQVGCEDEDIFLRVYDNSARGFFSKEWISFIDINKELDKASDDTPVTSTSLHALFKGKSVNTAGFLMAILKAEGLLEYMKGKRRYYQRADSGEFIDEVKRFIFNSQYTIDRFGHNRGFFFDSSIGEEEIREAVHTKTAHLAQGQRDMDLFHANRNLIEQRHKAKLIKKGFAFDQ